MSQRTTRLGLLTRIPNGDSDDDSSPSRPSERSNQACPLWTPRAEDIFGRNAYAGDPPHPASAIPRATSAHVKSQPRVNQESSCSGRSLSHSSTRFDWDLEDDGGPLFAYHLHQHEVLRVSTFSVSARTTFLRDWIRHHRRGVGWDPHPISLRLFCWGKLLATPGLLATDAELHEEMLRSMASQAETLAHGLETRLQANHLLTNLMAVVFVGLLLEGEVADGWLNRSDALLVELDSQIRPDGGHEERSPMYHALLLENVLDLLNLCQAHSERVPDGFADALEETAARMLEALEVMTHADGEIALFADSAFDVASSPAVLGEYASRLSVRRPSTGPAPSLYLPQTGYLRLKSGSFHLIASVSGPSPAHQPGHAHCDALSFELSVRGRRVVTDTGLFEYRPGARRDRARSTSGHSTFEFDGAEQAEVWAAHRVGGRPVVECSGWNASGSGEAICRGWSPEAPLHRRRFSVDEASALITDRVEGSFEVVRFRLPIDPAWAVVLDSTRAVATCRCESFDTGAVVIELANRFDWTLERGHYYPTFGLEIERFVLVGVAAGAESDWGEAVTRFSVRESGL